MAPSARLDVCCRRAGSGESRTAPDVAQQAEGESVTRRRLVRSLVSSAIIVVALSSGGVARSWAAEEDVMRPRFYMDQVSDAMPLKTMRGIWRYKEKREGQVSF